MVDLENSIPQFQNNLQQPGRYTAASAISTGKPLLVIHSLSMFVLLVSIILSSSLFMFIVSTISGMKYTYLDQKGLAIYQDIFPGQAVAALDRFACNAEQRAATPYGVTTTSHTCAIFPQREPFHLIQVVVNQGKITELTFFSVGLQPEMLFEYWGEPDATFRSVSHLSYRVEWHKRQYWASAIVNESARAVHMITLRVVG